MSVRSERMVRVEAITCPSRMQQFGPWTRDERLDAWERGRWAATPDEARAEIAEFMAAYPTGSIGNVEWLPGYGVPEQPRTCSFCGGVHPDDAVALVRAGWTVDGTDKAYKRYLAPPGYRAWTAARGWLDGSQPALPSPVPPVKLYTWHLDEAQAAAFNAALRSGAATPPGDQP